MQIQIFTIPIIGGESELEDMNHFLRSNKVSDIRKEFVKTNESGFWTFCLTYLPDVAMRNQMQAQGVGKKEKVDYKNVLDEAAFARFSEMRVIRRNIAETEAIPPYAIFTDAELAEIAKIENPTMKDLLNVNGIGKRKLEKYGSAFCIDLQLKDINETDRKSD